MTEDDINRALLEIYKKYAHQMHMTDEDETKLYDLEFLTSDEDADEGGGHAY